MHGAPVSCLHLDKLARGSAEIYILVSDLLPFDQES